MNKNSNITKEALQQLYVERKLSSVKVAREIGASSAAVHNALRRFGIPARSRTEASKKRWAKTYKVKWKPLVKKYMKGYPLEEIAQEVGCSLGVAAKHLREHGAVIRRPGAKTNRPNFRNTIPFDVKRAIKMNKDGATLTEIGQTLSPDRPLSIQVISRRFKSVGYKPLVHKKSTSKFRSYQADKREVAEAIDASRCVICGETRSIQLCHVQARRHGGKLVPENALALCVLHHDCFDKGLLTRSEAKKLKPRLLAAKEKGYTHHTYEV
jgi:hypothetical protein